MVPARRKTGLVLVLAVLGVVLVAGLAGGLIGLPDVEAAIEEAPERLGDGTYAFAAAMAALEMSSLLGVPLPFEVGVILSGAVAGEGEISLLALVPVVWVTGAAAEQLNYLTGRRFGRPFLVRHGPRFSLGPDRLARLEDHFARHGRATVFFGHVIPFVRSSAPFVAGASLMPWRTFLVYSVAGCLFWAALFSGLGYGFYRSAERVADLSITVGYVLLGIVVLAGVALALWRRRRARLEPAS